MVSSKRGLAIPWNFEPSHFLLYTDAASVISWASNWELWTPSGLPASIPFVPQVRTAKEAPQIAEFLARYSAEDRLETLLGFNEPDISRQANLTVQEAVDLWKKYILPLKEKYQKLRIGSPAVSNGPDGMVWLRAFLEAFGGAASAGVDCICLHFYGPDVETFRSYLTLAHQEFGLPIWVTEFACTNWNTTSPVAKSQVLGFILESTQWMDQTDWVEKYAWFGAMEDVGEGVGRCCGLQERTNDAKNEWKLSNVGRLYVKE
jgi:hypothetical protein